MLLNSAISAGAQLDRHVFYEHFADKRRAFLALHEQALRQSTTIGAAAYFTANEWPERVWRCLHAVSQLNAAHPAIAHVGFVETHALGWPAIQRVEESFQVFATLLLADGQQTGRHPSVTGAEAIGAAIFAIAYDGVYRGHAKDLPRYVYHSSYLALAPFLGVQAANEFLDRKLKHSEDESQSRKRRPR